MAQAARRKFPPAAGAMGWIGAALMTAGFLLELVALGLLMWMAFTRNAILVLPIIAAFLISFGFIGAAVLVWRRAWKLAGAAQPSAMTPDDRTRFIREGVIVTMANALALGAFAFLVLQLPGSVEHRVTLAAVPICVSVPISLLGTNRILKMLNRPPRRFLGLPERYEVISDMAMALVAAVVLLFAGLFLIPQ
jgi:hypothetical protein